MHKLKTVALTHRNFTLEDIGLFHIEDAKQENYLKYVKEEYGFQELMFLSTCNRVEIIFVTNLDLTTDLVAEIFKTFIPELTTEKAYNFALKSELFEGEKAAEHLFKVASSLDSMVVGEREIITQVRQAYERAHSYSISGDYIRILIKNTIETAKKVYTQTNISNNPVSIVSLAYKKLIEKTAINANTKVLVIGAGVTNTNMLRFFKKHDITDFTIYNRTLANAHKLTEELGGVAKPLNELGASPIDFDILLTCTGSEGKVITPELYKNILSDNQKKTVIDLAIPNDFDAEIINSQAVNYISINELREIAKKNIKERQEEVVHAEAIIKEALDEFHHLFHVRKVELAMNKIPKQIKDIKHKAITNVFAKDIELLDDQSQETLNKIVQYLEKKYISLPMKMAKEILLNQDDKFKS